MAKNDYFSTEEGVMENRKTTWMSKIILEHRTKMQRKIAEYAIDINADYAQAWLVREREDWRLADEKRAPKINRETTLLMQAHSQGLALRQQQEASKAAEIARIRAIRPASRVGDDALDAMLLSIKADGNRRIIRQRRSTKIKFYGDTRDAHTKRWSAAETEIPESLGLIEEGFFPSGVMKGTIHNLSTALGVDDE